MDKYSASFVSRPTLFREIIELGSLKLQGLSKKELKEMLIEDNILKLTSERRKREISSAVLNRVEALNQKELVLLINGSLSEKKYINMISIMKTQRFIRELINEVYVEKLEIGQTLIDDGDFNVFFRKKAEQYETVAKWKDITIKKMKQVIKKMLKELELVKIEGKNMEIMAPLVSQDFIDAIEDEDSSIKRLFIRGY